MLLGETLVTVSELQKSHGDREILKDMSFTLHRGARIGVIGANGVGKSTFMRILSREETDYRGSVQWSPGIRVGYVAQEPTLDDEATVRHNVDEGLRHIHEILEAFDKVCEDVGSEADPKKMEKLNDRMTRLQDEIDAVDGWEWEHQLEVAMAALRLPPGDQPVKNLSGGERRRVALCRELISSPDLLILDEPTNHLDAATLEWLEVFIDQYRGTVVMVTHDRYFLDNVANYMVELEDGRLAIYEGNYSDYLEKKSQRLAIAERVERRRQTLLSRELEWLNTTPAARTSKSKARVKNYHQLLEEGPNTSEGGVRLVIPPGPRLGDKVLEIENLKKSYDGRVLFEGLSLEIVPGQIVGICGPNGVGKTTLLRIILGQESPDQGKVTIGSTVRMTYVDQTREQLDASKTVYEEISEGRDVITVGAREFHIREYLSGFQFKGGMQQTPVGKLSGGERNRLLLAKTMRRGANLLLLDEPTNDLDLGTLRVLEEALENFAGSAIVISHDRFFLDKIANTLLIFEEEGKARLFDGNFEGYFEVRKRELDEQGVRPGKYRKTTYRKMKQK
ncbi:MAG: energy-dependent translational throttle protein EttA [Planctomycetota bacterium]|nr:energy-dependent translational throttle protein EttA [Planctomycetota bacterium]